MIDADRLRRGDRFTLSKVRYCVEYVNDTRAHCLPIDGEMITIRDRRTGLVRTWRAKGKPLDISPYSLVELERKR